MKPRRKLFLSPPNISRAIDDLANVRRDIRTLTARAQRLRDIIARHGGGVSPRWQAKIYGEQGVQVVKLFPVPDSIAWAATHDLRRKRK